MATPDLSNIPSEDLQHIAKGDMSKVSEPVLRYLAGQPQGPAVNLDKNGSVLAGPVGTALRGVANVLDPVADAAMATVRGTVAPVAGLAARVPAALQGQDTDAASAAAHEAVERAGAYTPQTPTGQAARADAGAVGRTVMAPFSAAAGAIENAVGPDAARVIESGSSKFNDVVGSLPAVGAVRELVGALRPVQEAMPIARGGVEAAHEAGYTGLKSRADLKTPGSQAITDQLISQDAGLLRDQTPNVANVQNARNIGPGRVYDRAEAALPPRMTQDPGLQADLQNLTGSTSQLPRSPDVEALRASMVEQPEMTNQQLFANIREARERSARGLASEDPDQNALGQAYGRLADAYEAFAGRQLSGARPGAPTLAEFQQARVAFAKNYLAEQALKGGEHFDPSVYGRAAQGNPDMLTGGAKIVGDAYNTLPAAGGDTAAKAVGALGGTAVGAALEHVLGPGAGIPAGVGSAVTGAYVAPAVNNAIRRFFTRGNPEAAAAAPTNPRLGYQFASPLDSQNALFGGRPAPQMELRPGPGTVGVTPQQGSLGDLLQGPPAAPAMDLAPPPGQAIEPMQRSLGELAQGNGPGPANRAAALKESAERGHARPGPATPPKSSPPGQPGPAPLPEPYEGPQPAEGRLPKRLGDFARETANRLGDLLQGPPAAPAMDLSPPAGIPDVEYRLTEPARGVGEAADAPERPHTVEAWQGGKKIGEMSTEGVHRADREPIVADMSVDEAHQRQGIATEMFRRLKEVHPGLSFKGSALTPKGEAFARSIAEKSKRLGDEF